MPIYEYECGKCGHRFERIQKISDRRVRTCPDCKAKRVERLANAPAIQFKGSGFYINDYSDKGKSRDKAAKAESKGDTKSETKKSETKKSSAPGSKSD